MKSIVLCLCVLWMPQWARADRLRVTSYDMDDSGGTIRLESDAAVGEPWLRIDGRTVRVWFPHVVDVARFDHERSNDDPIHALSLRPGASETAVLRIELGAARRVGKDDIVVSRQGTQAAIALHVGSLRAAPEPANRAGAPAAVNPSAPVALQKVARPNPQLTAAEVHPAPAQPTAASAAQPATGEATTTKAAATKADALPLLTAKTQDAEAGNSFVMLGIATFLLGTVYLGLQLWNRRRGQLPRPQIEVLGTRKLGHRQELMIVRALGSDHLLLCTGGRAERVASTPTPLALPGELEPAPVFAAPPVERQEEGSQAGGIGLISRLSSQHRLRKLLDAVEQETSEPEHEREHTGAFGTELASARAKPRRPSLHSLHSLPQPGAARQSDAVAGITKLRRRATQH